MEKQRWGRVREEKTRREKIREEKGWQERDAGARKGRKVAIHWVFPLISGSRGSKNRLAKAAGAEPSGQMRKWKNARRCGTKMHEAHFQVKKLKTPHVRTPFGSWHVEKVQFWKFRCRKSVRRCGAKHISKSKSLKTDGPGPLLEVEMSKKCKLLWREAHYHVKRTTFWHSDVEKVHAVLVRSAFSSQQCHNNEGIGPLLDFRCRFAWQVQGIPHLVKDEQNAGFVAVSITTTSTLHDTQVHYYNNYNHTTLRLHYSYNKSYSYKCTTLHYTTPMTLHYTTLQYTTLHYTTLNHTKLQYSTLHYTALHYTTLTTTTTRTRTTTTTTTTTTTRTRTRTRYKQTLGPRSHHIPLFVSTL